jgi:hypothetical protein
MPNSAECSDADARGAARASLYLAATLYCDGCSSLAKIRNLSATGALVESAATPAAGELVQLVRGGLIVHGLVAWSDQGRCGLRFSGSIDVQQWRSAPANAAQQRVDEVVRLVKAGAVPLPLPQFDPIGERSRPADSAGQLSADLRRVSDLLEALSDTLASDSYVMTRAGPVLQNLDIAMQVIAAVEAIVDGRGNVDREITRLDALRTSADQALQRCG